MDKLQILLDTILGEPVDRTGIMNNIVFINTLYEVKTFRYEDLHPYEKEIVSSIFDDRVFEGQNDLILSTQVKALSIIYFRKYGNERIIFDKIEKCPHYYQVLNLCIFALERTFFFDNYLLKIFSKFLENIFNLFNKNQFELIDTISKFIFSTSFLSDNRVEFIITSTPVFIFYIKNQIMKKNILLENFHKILKKNTDNNILNRLKCSISELNSVEISINSNTRKYFKSLIDYTEELNKDFDLLEYIIGENDKVKILKETKDVKIFKLTLILLSNKKYKFSKIDLNTISITMIKEFLIYINNSNIISINKKDGKNEIEEEFKKNQSLNSFILIYFFHIEDLRMYFKQYSLKYNIPYYQRNGVWYSFDNYLGKELKVPMSFSDNLEEKINTPLLDSISDSDINRIKKMAEMNLPIENIFLLYKDQLSIEQINCILKK